MSSHAPIVLGLLAGIVGVYFQVIEHDFVSYDDQMYLARLQAELGAESIWRAFTQPFQVNWIPLTWISLLVDHALYGDEPAGFLLTNVALHALATVLLYLAFARMTSAIWPSAFVAAVFAIHPLHVESVAWMSERKDVLSGVFFGFTLLAYARWAERRTAGRYALVGLALVLGLLSKPTVVTLPCLLLLLDYWPLARLRTDPTRRLPDAPRFGRALLEKLPFFAVAAAVAAVTLAAQRPAELLAIPQQVEVYPFGARLANALQSYVIYVWQSLWPSGLIVFYPHPGDAIPVWSAAAAALALAAVTATVLWAAATRPYLAVGWLWYLGTLVPMIGLVQVGAEARADRYMYLPLIGLAILPAFGGADLLGRRRGGRIALTVAASAALVAFASVAFLQVRYWRNTVTLFGRAVAVAEDNAFAHSHLGSAYQKLDRLQEAETHLTWAIMLRPTWAMPRFQLADVFAQQARWEEAVPLYQRGLAAQPTNARVRLNLAHSLIRLRRYDEANAEFELVRQQPDGLGPFERFSLQQGLARTSWEQGRPGDTIGHYRRALEVRPKHPSPNTNLGVLLVRIGRFEEARPHLERALAGWPRGSSGALAAQAASAAAAGRHGAAVRSYRVSLRQRPDQPFAADHLAWILATAADAERRAPAAAIRLAEAGLDEGSTHSIRLDTLAAGYAAAGRFPEAVRAAEVAARNSDDEILAQQIRARLALYRAGRPYVERAVRAAAPSAAPDG
jgi:tetratricopeptide (TPR) repeat protein